MIDNFVLIIGAMKSGTTSLYNYLAQHPEIAPCHTKEINFFGNPNRFNKGFDFYQSLWNWNPQQHKYALEATPSYTRVTHPKMVNAAGNISLTARRTGAKFKLIYIIRNPVDRIESHYTQGRKYNSEDTSLPISEGINKEIVDTSRYAMQVAEYYQRFAAEDILLLNFDDLNRMPERLLGKVCDFLDIDSKYHFQGTDVVHNSYSQKSTRVILPGYSKLRKTDFVRDIVKFMPRDIKQYFSKVRNLLAREYKYDYVKLSSEQRSSLFQELAPDLAELKDKYNFDVGSWKI